MSRIETLYPTATKVRMRDRVHLSVGVFRPDTKQKLPALRASAIYNEGLHTCCR